MVRRTMENDERSGKKARVEVPTSDLVQVKQEAPDQGEGREIMVANAAGQPRAEVAVTFDKLVLDCPLCSSPLKPPVFQCRSRHTACISCHAMLPSNKCQTCSHGIGGVYEHNHVLDTFVLAAKMRCPYEAFGCRTSVAYCLVGDHQLVCPNAPCPCPEPACGFGGSPPMLLVHLAAQHAWPVTPIAYGTVHVIDVPASERHRLLVSDGEESLFLLDARERGDGGLFVSMACIRANPAAGPRHKYKVWTQSPVDPESGCKDTLMLEAGMKICAVPCMNAAAAAEEATVLSVPPSMLHGEPKEMVLRVRIDKTRKRNLIQAAPSS